MSLLLPQRDHALAQGGEPAREAVASRALALELGLEFADPRGQPGVLIVQAAAAPAGPRHRIANGTDVDLGGVHHAACGGAWSGSGAIGVAGWNSGRGFALSSVPQRGQSSRVE